MPLITPYLKCGLPSKNESKNISIYMHVYLGREKYII